MEEPPPWDDAALDAQAAAMEIPGAAPVASAPAPKPKPKAAPAPKPAYTPPPKPDSRYPVLKGRAIGDKPVDIVELAEDSGIVVIEGTVTGVEDANVAKAVAGVKYYNLAGVESTEPFTGVNIVKTTYTDGSQSVAKKVIK